MSEKTEKKPRVQKDGVGKLAQELILAGGDNESVFNAVKAKFPEAKTSMASINWYRNKLRGEGKGVKTSRELRAAKKADPIEG
jgi:hypothetical protein